MGKALAGAARTRTIAINTTYYQTLGMARSDNMTTEANNQFRMKTAGTFSKLMATFSANTYTTANLTIRFRKNTANGNQSITVSAASTGLFEDASNTDSVAVDDLVNTSVASDNSGSGSSTLNIVAAAFEAGSGHVSLYSTGGTAESLSTASTTTYRQLGGSSTFSNATEANVQYYANAAGTFANLCIYAISNARTTNSTLRFRKNGANGNQSVTVTASTTGFFQDTSNSDTVASGDLLNTTFTTGTGTGTTSFSVVSTEFTSSGSDNDIFLGSVQSFTASATPSYVAAIGAYAGSTSRTGQQLRHGFAVTASKLKCHVSANTSNGTTTVASDVNGASGNQSLSIATTATGFFQDASNSDSLSASDLLCTSIVGGTSGNVTFDNFGYLETVSGGGGSSVKTVLGLAYASVKTVNGLAVASVKTVMGLA